MVIRLSVLTDKIGRFSYVIPLAEFADGFPQTIDVGGSESAVVKTVTGSSYFIPDHASVVRADVTVKPVLIKSFYDSEDIQITTGGKMCCFVEVVICLVLDVP